MVALTGLGDEKMYRPQIDGSRVVRRYRVQDGAAILLVTEDRKIFITSAPAEDGFGFSYIANVGDRGADDRISKRNICMAANCG